MYLYTSWQDSRSRFLDPTYRHVSIRLTIVSAKNVDVVVEILARDLIKELITSMEAVVVENVDPERRGLCIILGRTPKQGDGKHSGR